MKSSDGILLTVMQEDEAALLKRLANQTGWELETIIQMPNSTALEYQLRNRAHQPGRNKNYCLVRGASTQATVQQLESHLMSQLQRLPFLKTP
jgi:hypothetical protein